MAVGTENLENSVPLIDGHGATTGRRTSQPVALQPNELIGQEGGQFDAMYLEEVWKMSRYCSLIMDPLYNGYVCCRCNRRVSMMVIRTVSPIILECGVPSIYDYHAVPTVIRPNIPIIVDRTNELLGQEGGRFDSFYLEDA